MSITEKIKQMDLEKWVHENCIYKGKPHSAHYCLELFRRKVVLKILAVHKEKLQTAINELYAEIHDQKYQLSPQGNAMIDYDDVRTAICNLEEKFGKMEKEVENKRKKKPSKEVVELMVEGYHESAKEDLVIVKEFENHG